jgi:hypothetical protein
MFGVSFNPISLLATSALGPMGPIAQLALQVVSQMGQNLIQQMGERLNLPQSVIDLAQADYAVSRGDIGGAVSNLEESIGSLGQQLGASPTDIGDAQRRTNESLREAARDAADLAEGSSGSSGKGGWLRALAHALGKIADKQAADLEQRAKGLDGAKPSETADFQADTQAFNLLMSGITNAIKTIGDSLGQAARKN